MDKIKNFRNIVSIPDFPFKIDHKQKILSLGSCFSNQMFSCFKNHAFDAFSPFGTVYNPISIAMNLERCMGTEWFTKNDVISYKDVFFSWFHSGKYFSNKESLLIKEINYEAEEISQIIHNQPIIIATFGSAIVYCLKSNHQVVANCHKQNPSLFYKRKLSINEIVETWSKVIDKLETDFIFSVSPVRHYRNGFVENNRSKAILLLAVEELSKMYPKKVTYFPSYEIMMDELRDYRFYGKDWVHPTQEAVSYIWDKFSRKIFSSSTNEVVEKISNIRLRLNHRPNYGITIDHIKFLKKLKQDIINIKPFTPLCNWGKEIESIDNLIK
tara:strand:- start:545 stop:1525 length:981 start_codon:yes stop_codon:yes gene_type:complete